MTALERSYLEARNRHEIHIRRAYVAATNGTPAIARMHNRLASEADADARRIERELEQERQIRRIGEAAAVRYLTKLALRGQRPRLGILAFIGSVIRTFPAAMLAGKWE
jgi:hypothetical protein